MRDKRNSTRIRKGASAVEFAIVAPVFFLFVLAIIELGRMVMLEQMIVNASREGARAAVLENATADDVENTVLDRLSSFNTSNVDVEINPSNPASAGFGDPIEVTVSIPFADVSLLAPFFANDRDITGSTTMRCESY